jgi:hypothetical protein
MVTPMAGILRRQQAAGLLMSAWGHKPKTVAELFADRDKRLTDFARAGFDPQDGIGT